MPVLFALGGLTTGGNETVALQILERLDRQRFAPSIVSLSKHSDSIINEFRALKIPLHIWDSPARSPWRFVWSLASLARRNKTKAVLCFSFSTLHLWVHLGARLAGVPKRITRVGSWFEWNEPKLRRLHRLGTLVCNQEVAVSNHVARKLRESGKEPSRGLVVVPNGCNVEEIRRRAEHSRLQAGPPPAHTIVMVSRMDDAKDQDTLIRALPLVRLDIPQARLRLIGDGPRRPVLEGLARNLGISDAVEFTGLRRDIPEQLGAAAVFAFSTRTEGFPNALIEGMAAGLPIVASDIPACREVLNDGAAGILVPQGNVQAMANAITPLLRSTSIRQKAGEAAYRRVQDNYQIEDMICAYERLLDNAAA